MCVCVCLVLCCLPSGLLHGCRFVGSRAILSGPAGGVVCVCRAGMAACPNPNPPQVGYAVTAYHHQLCGGCQRLPVIGFDMGGTSTDVSRYTGEYEHIFESTVAGVVIQSPQVGPSQLTLSAVPRLCVLCSWTSAQWRPGVGPCSASGQASLWWGPSLQGPILDQPATPKASHMTIM